MSSSSRRRSAETAFGAVEDANEVVPPEVVAESGTINEQISAVLGNLPQERDSRKRFKKRTMAEKAATMMTPDNFKRAENFLEKTDSLELSTLKKKKWFYAKDGDENEEDLDTDDGFVLDVTGKEVDVHEYCARTLKQNLIDLKGRMTDKCAWWKDLDDKFKLHLFDRAFDELKKYRKLSSEFTKQRNNCKPLDLDCHRNGFTMAVNIITGAKRSEGRGVSSIQLARYLAVATRGYQSKSGKVDPDEYLRRLESGEAQATRKDQDAYEKAIGGMQNSQISLGIDEKLGITVDITVTFVKGRTNIEADFEAKWAIPAFADDILTPGIFVFVWLAVKGVFLYDWREILDSKHPNYKKFEYRVDAQEEPFIAQFNPGAKVNKKKEATSSVLNRMHKHVFKAARYNVEHISLKSSRKAFAEAAKRMIAALLSGDKENLYQKKINHLQSTRLPPGEKSEVPKEDFARIRDSDEYIIDLREQLVAAITDEEKKRIETEITNATRSLKTQTNHDYRPLKHKTVAGRQPLSDRTSSANNAAEPSGSSTGLENPDEAAENDRGQFSPTHLWF
ncbi:hypothetical protein HDU96_010878 [Phlyctochytrium bullatum]|nr:hypothetical protein HDU96_010878 [Phlyctochytrium bullatum]